MGHATVHNHSSRLCRAGVQGFEYNLHALKTRLHDLSPDLVFRVLPGPMTHEQA